MVALWMRCHCLRCLRCSRRPLPGFQRRPDHWPRYRPEPRCSARRVTRRRPGTAPIATPQGSDCNAPPQYRDCFQAPALWHPAPSSKACRPEPGCLNARNFPAELGGMSGARYGRTATKADGRTGSMAGSWAPSNIIEHSRRPRSEASAWTAPSGRGSVTL